MKKRSHSSLQFSSKAFFYQPSHFLSTTRCFFSLSRVRALFCSLALCVVALVVVVSPRSSSPAFFQRLLFCSGQFPSFLPINEKTKMRSVVASPAASRALLSPSAFRDAPDRKQQPVSPCFFCSFLDRKDGKRGTEEQRMGALKLKLFGS